MDEKKIGIAWVMVLLVMVGAGVIYFKIRPSRYREQAGGLFRVDRETGRKHIFVNGKWQPVPEVNRAELQSKFDAMLAEQLARQVKAPTFELPSAATRSAPAAAEKK